MDDHLPPEPIFRANKRRKVFRRRETAEEESITPSIAPQSTALATVKSEEDSDDSDSATGVVRLQKKAGTKKHGIAFTSSNVKQAKDEEAGFDGALLLASGNEEQQAIPGDRFVKPTGKIAVAENKHMYELRPTFLRYEKQY